MLQQKKNEEANHPGEPSCIVDVLLSWSLPNMLALGT